MITLLTVLKLKFLKGHTMLKSIITAAVIATAALTTPAYASTFTVSQCVILGDAIESLSIARDNGISASRAFTILTDNGVPQEISVVLLELVYVTGKDIGGATLKGAFIGTCVGESV